MAAASDDKQFPVPACVLFGLGIGGFFDGIVLHQILQWHHMLSNRYEPNTVESLRFNTLWDGLFHSLTYIFILAGLFLLWRTARQRHLFWSSKLLIGSLLIGFGAFNLVEGLINHHLLGLHHVNETVARAYWIYWDVGFLLWGAAMLIGGWTLLRQGRREEIAQAMPNRAEPRRVG